MATNTPATRSCSVVMGGGAGRGTVEGQSGVDRLGYEDAAVRSACLQHRPGARVQLLDGAAQRAFTGLPGSARDGRVRAAARSARPDAASNARGASSRPRFRTSGD